MVQFNCGCTFIRVGEPPDNSTCRPHPTLTANGYDKHLHNKHSYKCDECACMNYAPRRELVNDQDWPACICGHSAQSHN